MADLLHLPAHLLGTLLTRAGLVSSVHAFAQSSIGTWFVVFMGIVLAVCIFTYVLQRGHLKTEHHLESLVSRESSFLFNNLVLLTACFVILWGTLFPILSEYVEGNKVTVGAPFYNRVAVPIGLFLLFLTGVGPLLPWRATSLKASGATSSLPIIALWATVIVCLAVGVQPWKDGAFDSGNFYALVAFAISRRRCSTAILSEFLPRRRRDLPPDRQESLCRHVAADAPQHPPLWRLHHSHRRGDRRHRAGRLGLQPQQRKRNGPARQAASSAPTRWSRSAPRRTPT